MKSLPFKNENLNLSSHCKKRIKERFSHLSLDQLIEASSQSVEIIRNDKPSTKVRRIIKNNFQVESYLTNLNYNICFVVGKSPGQAPKLVTLYPIKGSWLDREYPEMIQQVKEETLVKQALPNSNKKESSSKLNICEFSAEDARFVQSLITAQAGVRFLLKGVTIVVPHLVVDELNKNHGPQSVFSLPLTIGSSCIDDQIFYCSLFSFRYKIKDGEVLIEKLLLKLKVKGRDFNHFISRNPQVQRAERTPDQINYDHYSFLKDSSKIEEFSLRFKKLSKNNLKNAVEGLYLSRKERSFVHDHFYKLLRQKNDSTKFKIN